MFKFIFQKKILIIQNKMYKNLKKKLNYLFSEKKKKKKLIKIFSY